MVSVRRVTPAPFGDFQIRIDPWAVEYGGALAAARARAVEAGGAAEAATAKAAERAGAFAEALDRLTGAVAGAYPSGEAPALLAWMEQRRAELHAAKTERDRHDAAIRKAEGELAKAQLALAKAAGAAAQATDRRDQVVRDQT